MENNTHIQPSMYKNKVALATSNYGTLSVILWLRQQGFLNGVLLYGIKGQERAQFEAQLTGSAIPFVYAENNDEETVKHLDNWQTELLIVFNCGTILPERIFTFPTFGTINLHAAGLPDYRGPHPIYWQIRNAEKTLKLTAHRVTKKVDSGNIVAQLSIDIGKYDTHQTLLGKVLQHTPSLLEQLFFLDLCIDKTPGKKQLERTTKSAPRVTQQDLFIDWKNVTAKTLCNQVRAGNPIYGGAMISLGESNAQLLQASIVSTPTYGAKPGTIIHISPEQGVFVALKEDVIRLDIVANSEGVFDGYRFSQVFGLKTGMQFN